MASWEPSFRRGPYGLVMNDSAEVMPIKNQHRENDRSKSLSAVTVRAQAEAVLKKAGGDISNSKHLFGCFELQFGCFRGMSFKWILENSPGYDGWLVAESEKDLANPKESEAYGDRWVNKMAFKKYVEFFEEGRELVA
ncbi:uncharacterized protein LOC127851812 [Dreissena polymorpha]|uniref:Uncharacterized protein n=1 Tax=Dreissena polymorpha TaxID=45954 RepID=A0A9D4D5Q0_DREPO|nr:uncharacterized protein LOC127851812 [Dreissena polymorpha]KAH3738515.1 hypothetical protein DPMN_045150 [Dreissena polymorpha]